MRESEFGVWNKLQVFRTRHYLPRPRDLLHGTPERDVTGGAAYGCEPILPIGLTVP
jgi:hypothetical protein